MQEKNRIYSFAFFFSSRAEYLYFTNVHERLNQITCSAWSVGNLLVWTLGRGVGACRQARCPRGVGQTPLPRGARDLVNSRGFRQHVLRRLAGPAKLRRLWRALGLPEVLVRGEMFLLRDIFSLLVRFLRVSTLLCSGV